MTEHFDTGITFPKRPRGRPSAAADTIYREQLRAFCDEIQKIDSTLDFKVSSRGWCYILEEHGLQKGDFDSAQRLINDCRKSGDLPLDICAEDGKRIADHLEEISDETPAEFAGDWIDHLRNRVHLHYQPISFWDDLDVYVEMLVEKGDLKSLFAPIVAKYHIATANAGGWSDLNVRAAMMNRFADWEAKSKQCVLLYCGDHDPGGLNISSFLRANLEDLSGATGWDPENLLIDRFGLNADFIEAQGLTWIDNLETSAGGRLDDHRHPDHHKSYVFDYLRRFGVRKVEANALMVRPEAGRQLCEDAIRRHVPDGAVESFAARLAKEQERARRAIARLLNGSAP
jgi:hypothetical protein